MNTIQKLVATVKRLRDPEKGCPWDQKQTHQSLTTCLLEETAEVLEAIDTGNMTLLREELGDLLLQIIMHCQIAEESESFDFEAVCQEINQKLIRRHPHIFENHNPKLDPELLIKRWEEIKADEKAKKGIIEDGIFKKKPPQLNALLQTKEIVKQIDIKNLKKAKVKFDEKQQGSSQNIIASKMYALVEQCHRESLDPENILRNYLLCLKSSIENEIRSYGARDVI